MTTRQARRRHSRTNQSQAGAPAGCSPRVMQPHARDPMSYLVECDLDIIPRAVEELRPYERNPRKHPPKQIEKLAASIREFGFLIPVLIEADGRIIAGHARVEAAKAE